MKNQKVLFAVSSLMLASFFFLTKTPSFSVKEKSFLSLEKVNVERFFQKSFKRLNVRKSIHKKIAHTKLNSKFTGKEKGKKSAQKNAKPVKFLKKSSLEEIDPKVNIKALTEKKEPAAKKSGVAVAKGSATKAYEKNYEDLEAEENSIEKTEAKSENDEKIKDVRVEGNFVVEGRSDKRNLRFNETTKKKDVPKSFEVWKSLVIDQANLDQTKELVKLFKKDREIVSKNLFYKIIRAMISSSDKDIFRLGILALKETPSSESFINLLELEASVSSPQKSSEIRSAVNEVYTQPSHMNFVLSILEKDYSKNIQSAAIKILRRSSEINLRFSISSNETDRRPSKEDIQNFIVDYQNSILRLQYFIQNSENKDLADEAASTLDLIEHLVGNFYENDQRLA